MNRADGTGLYEDAFLGPFPVGVEASPNEAADFDHDGNMDVTVAATSSQSAWISLGNGDGTFAAAQSVTVGNAPHGLAVLDIDGDADLDIATSNTGSNNVWCAQRRRRHLRNRHQLRQRAQRRVRARRRRYERRRPHRPRGRRGRRSIRTRPRRNGYRDIHSARDPRGYRVRVDGGRGRRQRRRESGRRHGERRVGGRARFFWETETGNARAAGVRLGGDVSSQPTSAISTATGTSIGYLASSSSSLWKVFTNDGNGVSRSISRSTRPRTPRVRC